MQAGAEKLPNLKVIYASNNKISSWADLDKVAQLTKLEELLLVGNPLYNDYKDRGALPEYRIEVQTPSEKLLVCRQSDSEPPFLPTTTKIIPAAACPSHAHQGSNTPWTTACRSSNGYHSCKSWMGRRLKGRSVTQPLQQHP